MIQKDGALFAFGFNLHGQLGINDERYEVTSPTKASQSFPAQIKQISTGGFHSLLLLGILCHYCESVY